MAEYLSLLRTLIQYNITLTLLAIAIALPISCVLAFARLSSVLWISVPARIYVNTLRSMPLVMVMFWIYLVIPMISGRSFTAYWSALVALSLFEIAYFTVVFRYSSTAVILMLLSAHAAFGMLFSCAAGDSISIRHDTKNSPAESHRAAGAPWIDATQPATSAPIGRTP